MGGGLESATPSLRAKKVFSSRQSLFPRHEFHADAVIVDDDRFGTSLRKRFMHGLTHEAHEY